MILAAGGHATPGARTTLSLGWRHDSRTIDRRPARSGRKRGRRGLRVDRSRLCRVPATGTGVRPGHPEGPRQRADAGERRRRSRLVRTGSPRCDRGRALRSDAGTAPTRCCSGGRRRRRGPAVRGSLLRRSTGVVHRSSVEGPPRGPARTAAGRGGTGGDPDLRPDRPRGVVARRLRTRSDRDGGRPLSRDRRPLCGSGRNGDGREDADPAGLRRRILRGLLRSAGSAPRPRRSARQLRVEFRRPGCRGPLRTYPPCGSRIRAMG